MQIFLKKIYRSIFTIPIYSFLFILVELFKVWLLASYELIYLWVEVV
jgi:hypothetical protein